MGCLAAILGETNWAILKNLSFRQRGEKKSHVFDTTAKQAMWRWRQVVTASQSGGKRESEVRVTSGCRRWAENVCCLSSLVTKAQDKYLFIANHFVRDDWKLRCFCLQHLNTEQSPF